MIRCCWRLYQKPSSPSKLAHPREWKCRVLPPSPNWIVAPRGNGDKGARSPNPLLAKQVLYQLSYVPKVGMAGFEPTTPTTPKWCATKLRYIPWRKMKDSNLRRGKPPREFSKLLLSTTQPIFRVALPVGLEPTTDRLEGGCSVQLS